jgi:hypothetical protein
MAKIVPSEIVQFIEARFPGTKSLPAQAFACDFNSAGVLSTVLSLVDRLPENLTPLKSWKWIRFAEAYKEISNAIALWHSGQPNALIYELRYMRDGSGLNPVTAVRDALLDCPDEGTAIRADELLFLSDQGFRDTISQDISSVNQALSNAEWKASTVLAGSIVEALLLNAIIQFRDNDSLEYDAARDRSVQDSTLGKSLTNKPENNPSRWTFEQYIHVAFVAGIISETIARECLLTKDYRNLIHHGASERKKQKCDRGTALVAVGAMEHVIKGLQDRVI